MFRLIYFYLFISINIANADLVLPDIFCDNMVLQEQMQVTIWGIASPGRSVTIKPSWSDKPLKTVADSKGKWKVKLETPKASFISNILEISTDDKKIELKNILVGQVWICSGQSNMRFPLKSCLTGSEEVPKANFAYIRLFQGGHKYSDVPLDNLSGKWHLCDPNSAANFSAVGYFFGKNLFESINKPIGLINVSWGGTPVEAWMTADAVSRCTEYNNYLTKKWPEDDNQYASVKKRYEARLEEWKQKVKTNSFLPKPSMPYQLFLQNKPSYCYNGMIAPIKGYSIAGVVWYQGEANTSSSEYQYYYDVFPVMIHDWRNIWDQGEFPFIYVQLAASKGYGIGVSHVRQAQMMTLKRVPNTGMVVTMDIGDPTDHHPKNKRDVGYRLSLWALKNVYGKKDIVISGPLYKSKKIEENKIRLIFNYVGDGLIGKGKQLTDFAICGDDHKFYPAKAVIDGNDILVWSEQVPKPKDASFAWCEYAEPDFYNKNGLPASPFNTYEMEVLKR